MKNIRNERGFTLIELLAVIVVLAIVMLMGAMAVIPRMDSARKQAFALEANTAKQGVQQFLMTNELKASGTAQVFPTNTSPICVTIKDLIDNTVVDFDSSYNGYVIVQRVSNTSSAYLYQISMTNGVNAVYNEGVSNKANVDITSDMVVPDNGTNISACPSSIPNINGTT